MGAPFAGVRSDSHAALRLARSHCGVTTDNHRANASGKRRALLLRCVRVPCNPPRRPHLGFDIPYDPHNALLAGVQRALLATMSLLQ